ncbi:succinyl-CoA synthetase-like protein [Elsinoe ampelina]|uniref:Succinyl-CoA synthetase-like protein n=1 Tax=Elsinoe ampelina TaxID=302913 RepID=A0A6A6G6E5_9PEZI|nr:succinyl-CoA synthetase-like protein [Elsinoe ampelina]
MFTSSVTRSYLKRRLGTCSTSTRSVHQDPAKLQEKTLQHLRIGRHTRVIYQGFTGRVATSNAQESLEWGTQVVGGVTPGKDGEHLGLPVCPSVRAAKEQLKPDATAIFVPMTGAAMAIEEAIEAEIPLIVAVAEHIPVHDILRIGEILRTTNKSRFVGANSPGIIAPLGYCRIGFQPLPIYKPGHVGVVAKSGTLSYEAVGSLTRAGLGQSICIGTGGDVASGTTLVDGFKVLVHDPDTHAIVIVGEVGGNAEEAVAKEIKNYRLNTKNPKPIVALVAGRTAPGNRINGHAGAFQGPTEGTAQMKYEALEGAGVIMCDHPEQFGPTLKAILHARRSMPQNSSNTPTSSASTLPGQRRGYHTSTRPAWNRTQPITSQRRHLHIKGAQACDLLQPLLPSIPFDTKLPKSSKAVEVGVSINRLQGRPRTIYRPNAMIHNANRGVSFDLSFGITKHHFAHIEAQIQTYNDRGRASTTSPTPHTTCLPFLPNIYTAFASFQKRHEAISVTALLTVTDSKPLLSVPKIHLDDAAFKSASRQPDLFALRDKTREDARSVAAEDHGIVYITLSPDSPSANIGTLVNGAGLAMNTVDVLSLPPYNGSCANFLDTGGKATSATVKKSFELILSDGRVRVIFVNIFGGLTDCGMIADGIILAFKEVDMRGVPVVVRLRGTNEEVGQRKIQESGLELEAFDGFEEAAGRVVELAGRE